LNQVHQNGFQLLLAHVSNWKKEYLIKEYLILIVL
jgi:hypothetical protein